MEDGGDAKPLRGTRPYEGMVPGKPWTAQFMTISELEARQTRCGPNFQRHRDGTLRADRLLPPRYVPSPRLDEAKLSPRFKRPTPLWEWPGASQSSAQWCSSNDTHFVPPPRQTLVVATRHGLSPRYRPFAVAEALGCEPPPERASPRRRLPALPPNSPRHDEQREIQDARSHRERLMLLEDRYLAEQHATLLARANLKSTLRWVPPNIDPRGLHDPDGQLFRRPA